MTGRRLGCVRAAVVALAVIFCGACTPPWARNGDSTSGDRRQLGRAAEPLAPAPSGADATNIADRPVSSAPSPASAPEGSAPATTTAAAPGSESHSFNALLERDDAVGDAGLEAPGYADLLRLRLSSSGRLVCITVDVGAEAPAQLATGEVVGLGVDLYRTGGQESDHQLFADGGSDGWRAYLQTPDGFVQYPGRFRMGGTTIEFEVPWSSIGGDPPFEVSVFLDWSKERVALNASASDHLPDRGRITVPAG